MQIPKENITKSMQTHSSHITISPLFFFNFPNIFKINQFVGQSETCAHKFESKSGIGVFRCVHKKRMLNDTIHIVVF